MLIHELNSNTNPWIDGKNANIVSIKLGFGINKVTPFNNDNSKWLTKLYVASSLGHKSFTAHKLVIYEA